MVVFPGGATGIAADSGGRRVLFDTNPAGGQSFSRRVLIYLPLDWQDAIRAMIRSPLAAGVLLILSPLFIWLLLIALQVTLPLSSLNVPLAHAATAALDRPVSFTGDIRLVPSLVPTLEVTGVSIGNPTGREGKLVHIERVHMELDLLSLLFQEFVLESIQANGVTIGLWVYEDGSQNWDLSPEHELGGTQLSEQPAVEQAWTMAADVRHIDISDITISYIDLARGANLAWGMDSLRGHLPWSEELLLQGKGHYLQQPMELAVTGGTLQDLLLNAPDWFVHAELKTPGLELALNWDRHSSGSETTLSVQGPSLHTLSPVAGFDVPAWGPYRAAGKLAYTDNSYVIPNLELELGESRMNGVVHFRMEDQAPHLDADLSSTRLQLDDFWIGAVAQEQPASPGQEGATVEDSATGAAVAIPNVAEENSLEPRGIEYFLSGEVLENFSLDLKLEFQELFLGQSLLGDGRLSARTEADSVTVRDLHVNIPEGGVDLTGKMALLAQGYALDFQLSVANFDYGVLVRHDDPESEVHGKVYLNLDLQSTTPHLEDTLRHGSGLVDVGVWPEVYQPGTFDTWSVGLVKASLEQFEPQSPLNCVVSRFELDKGVMHERSLMIDTEKMRVLGDAVIDFNEQTVDVILVPRIKERIFVNLATPVQLIGSFQDFEPRVKGSDIAFSVVRSGLNIVLLGIPLLFQTTLQPDGSADCLRAMGKDTRLSRK